VSRQYSGPGWTVTGGPGSRGRQVPPLPGGGIDWSRPRCEPDNRPHVVAGRALAVFGPILAVLPVLWFAIPMTDRLSARLAARLAEHDVNMPMLLAAAAGTILAICAVAGLVRSCGSAPPRAATAGSGRVQVDVTAVQPPVGWYPAGQLVYRVFDSPAMLPAATEPADTTQPGGTGRQGRALPQGRWSA
jgi:hypothetical protein